MSLADGIVLLLVACAAVAVLRFMRSQKKAGTLSLLGSFHHPLKEQNKTKKKKIKNLLVFP